MENGSAWLANVSEPTHAVFKLRTSQLAHKLKINKGKKRAFSQPSTQLTSQPTLLLIFILLSSRRELKEIGSSAHSGWGMLMMFHGSSLIGEVKLTRSKK